MRANIFTTEELEIISKHKHKKLGAALLDDFIYAIATWLQGFVPGWVSPNMVTITAHIPGLVSYIYLLWCSPNAREEVPSFAPLVYCYQLFHWMVLDTIDGVHARNTQQCSPIGKILDSSLDVISWIFSLSCLAIIFKLGTNPLYAFWLVFLTVSCAVGDAVTMLRMGGHAPGWLDLTEFAVIKSCLALMVYAYGDNFIYYKLPFFGNVQSVICGVFCLGAIGYMFIASRAILAASEHQNSEVKEPFKATLQNWGIFSLCGCYITLYSSFKDDATLVFLATSGMTPYLALVAWRLQLRELAPTLNVGIQYEYAGPVALVIVDLLGLSLDTHLFILGFVVVSWIVAVLFFVRALTEIMSFSKSSMETIK